MVYEIMADDTSGLPCKEFFASGNPLCSGHCPSQDYVLDRLQDLSVRTKIRMQ